MNTKTFFKRTREFASHEYGSVVGTVLVLVIGGVIARKTMDLHVVSRTLVDAEPLLLGAAVIVYLFSWPIRGRRYDAVLRAMNRHCGVRFLTAAIFLSQTANLVIPARGGDAIRVYLLKKRRGVSYPTGTASLAVERVFDLVALTMLGGLAFMALAYSDWTITTGTEFNLVTTPVVGVGISALAVVVATAGLARTNRAIAPALLARLEESRLSYIIDATVRTGADVRAVAANPRAVATINSWSLVAWGLDVLTAVLVLAALVGGFGGGSLSVSGLIAVGTLAVSLGNLAKVLPLSQGGIGLYEAAFTGLVVGITPIIAGTALAAAILDHALKNAVTFVGGVTAAIVFNVSPTTLQDEVDRPEGESPDF